jgi:hypothetical protein
VVSSSQILFYTGCLCLICLNLYTIGKFSIVRESRLGNVRFEALTAMIMKSIIFCMVRPCRLVTFYQTTLCHIPEAITLQIKKCTCGPFTLLCFIIVKLAENYVLDMKYAYTISLQQFSL